MGADLSWADRLRTLPCHRPSAVSVSCPRLGPSPTPCVRDLCSPGEAAGSAQLYLRPKPRLRRSV